MNILYLHDRLHGGAAESLYHLLRSRPSHDRMVVAYQHDGPAGRRLASLEPGRSPVRLYLRSWLSYRPRSLSSCLRFPFAVLRHLLSILRLLVILKRESIELIHTNCVHLAEGAFLSRVLNIPHIWTIRELLDLEHYGYDISKSRIARSLNQGASCILCNSDRSAQGLATLGVLPEKLRVLPNIIDPPRETKDLREHLNLPADTLLVATVGWITPIKNVEDFVEVAARLTDMGPKVKFVIIGSPTRGEAEYHESVLDSIRRSPNQSNTICAGPIDHVASYLSSLDVLVHPGRGEAFGRVVAEALLVKTPVVAVRGSAVEEIVDHDQTGFLVDRGDVGMMALHCRSLLDDSAKRRRFGETGAERMIARFSTDTLAPRYDELYREVMVSPLMKSRRDRSPVFHQPAESRAETRFESPRSHP